MFRFGSLEKSETGCYRQPTGAGEGRQDVGFGHSGLGFTGLEGGFIILML